ncbi:MAG: hypothetical protein AB8B84_11120 [Granulosicoccus sp.]
MSNETNRREAFRLDDSMLLCAEKLEQPDLDTIIDNFDEFRLRYCFTSHFKLQREKRRSNLLMIRKRDPDIGNYLDSMEEQMMLVASCLSDTEALHHSLRMRDVNISCSSVSFPTEREFTSGDHLKLQLVLSTSAVQVFSIAEVTRVVRESSEHPYIVAAKFKHLHEDDAEALIRHMAKLQQIKLQARREG